jgi:hypothetical protein
MQGRTEEEEDALALGTSAPARLRAREQQTGTTVKGAL